MHAHTSLAYATIAFAAGVSLGAKLLHIDHDLLPYAKDVVILLAYGSLCRH